MNKTPNTKQRKPILQLLLDLLNQQLRAGAGAHRSKYLPHQGAQEATRRRRQMGTRVPGEG